MGKCCKWVAPYLSITPFLKWQFGWLESMNTSLFWCSLQRNASYRRKPAYGLLFINSRDPVHAIEGVLPLWFFCMCVKTASMYQTGPLSCCEPASSDEGRKGLSKQLFSWMCSLRSWGVSCSSKPHVWFRMLGWLEGSWGGRGRSRVSQSIRAAHR